jgi:microcystin-dependent protein
MGLADARPRDRTESKVPMEEGNRREKPKELTKERIWRNKSPPALITQLAPNALPPAGGDQPHNNLMPYLTLNFCIALQGVFPPRT